MPDTVHVGAPSAHLPDCGDCGNCGGRLCDPFKGELAKYDGIRFTADGFDCALPVSIDPFSTCAYDCLYCFSNFLARDPHRKEAPKVGEWSIATLERFLDFDSEKKISRELAIMQDALRRPTGPRCPVQLGALGDPFDNIERHRRWSLRALPLFRKYEQPVRISSKGGLLLQQEEYLREFRADPRWYWVAFSTITIDDEIIRKIDRLAPTATDRLKAMAALSKIGVKTSLRMRPIIKNVTDRTPRYRKAWRDLIRKAADAGACAVSMEFMFVPGVQPDHIKDRIDKISGFAGFNMTEFYRKTTSRFGACLRSSRSWKEEMVFAVREEAKALGMVFAVSDPHWKELNDTGCCCGMLPDDPIWGNYERENACEALVNARERFERGERPVLVRLEEIVPPWSEKINMRQMVCCTGPKGAIMSKHFQWKDKLAKTWNNIRDARGPLLYFGGVVKPHSTDENGNMVYEYVGSERKHIRTGWDV